MPLWVQERCVCWSNHTEGDSDLCEKGDVSLSSGQALSADIYSNLMIITMSPRIILEGSRGKTVSKQTITCFVYFWILDEEFSHIPKRLILKTELLLSRSGHKSRVKVTLLSHHRWHFTEPGTKHQLHSFSATLCPPETNPLTTTAPTFLAVTTL